MDPWTATSTESEMIRFFKESSLIFNVPGLHMLLTLAIYSTFLSKFDNLTNKEPKHAKSGAIAPVDACVSCLWKIATVVYNLKNDRLPTDVSKTVY